MTTLTTHPDITGNGRSDSRPTREMAAELQRLIERGRVRWRMLILAEAASLTVAAPLAYLWGVFLLDNLVHLPAWGLLLANAVFLIGLAWLVRRLVRQWRRARFTADQVALAIEHRTPGGVQNRLINALQLSRGATAGDAAAAEAVIGENYHALKQIELQQSSESRPAIVRAVIALLLVAVGVGFWSVSSERFTTSAGRLFLPLAGIEPVYRTRMAVQPGNVTIAPGTDVVVQVRLDGTVPESLQLMIQEGDRQSSHRLRVDPQTSTASYTLANVRGNMTYSLRGGDYRTPAFQITVPQALELRALEARATYPAYTKLGERRLESRSGDLEALAGTTAELTFTLNQPVEAAWLEFAADADGATTQPASASLAGRRLELTRTSPEQYTASYTFAGNGSYVLHARRPDGGEMQAIAGRLNATADAAPQVQLIGLDADREVMLEDVLNLTVRADDDHGLGDVGLFWRPVPDPTGDEPAGGATATEWQPVRTWNAGEGEQSQQFRSDVALLLSALAVAEGDRLELAGRARDTDPAKAGQWTTGATYTLTASSPGAALQLIYERILRSERAIEDLIDQHTDLDRQASRWISNFEPTSGMRWDEQKNLEALKQAMAKLAEAQSQIRLTAGATARQMPPEAGRNFPQGLAMLADTEMVRHIRVLEKVAEGATPQEKRSTLAEARLTVQRTIRSLKEMQDRYVEFREDWELNHMITFTDMLARRQERLAEASQAYVELSGESLGTAQRESIGRRQGVLLELSELAEQAFEGMADREEEVGPILAKAFAAAADAYATSGLKDEMKRTSALLATGSWAQAQPLQHAAAEKLSKIHADLRAAQTEVARQVLAELEEMAKSSVEAQRALEELRAGQKNKIAMEENLTLEDTLRMVDVAKRLREKAKQEATASAADRERLSFENAIGRMQTVARNELDTRTHTLSDEAMPDKGAKQDDTPGDGNSAQAVIMEELEDVIGDLVSETEELVKDFTSYKATASWQVADTGTDVGRITSDPMSSSGATSTTGNQAPPAEDVGGAARTGRLGARSHGLAVGDDFVDRYGRAAQEGQENIQPQGGAPMRERTSATPQGDEATGTGGRTVDSKQTHFSTKDAGKWNDGIADNMEKPQEKVQIVERHGEAISADVVAKMRDLNNRQEQIIERIKAVKKELDALFLPTDRLDEIAAKLQQNLDRLRESPDADVFREQAELLSQLQASVVVFQGPSSEFVQSLPRQQRIKGQILDEKAPIPFPGYEEAVQSYYRRLSNLEDPQ